MGVVMKMLAATLLMSLSTAVAQAHPAHPLHAHLNAVADPAAQLPAPLLFFGIGVAWAIALRVLDHAASWRRRFGV